MVIKYTFGLCTFQKILYFSLKKLAFRQHMTELVIHAGRTANNITTLLQSDISFNFLQDLIEQLIVT